MQTQAMLGADPELFVHNGNDLIPIFGLLGGTKEHPIQMKGLPKGFMFQEDGAAAEFNIPPAKTAEEFADSITTAIMWLKKTLRGTAIVATSSAITLKPADLEHKAAKEIGCLADFCGYMAPPFERKPYTAETLGNKRFAGGHLHLSYKPGTMPAHIAARFMDLYVGLPTVGLDPQTGRREYYGLAGLYRMKDYGVEYRTMSGLWLHWDTAKRARMARNALTLGNNTFDPMMLGRMQRAYADVPWQDVQRAIENQDTKMAVMLLDLLNGKFQLGIGEVYAIGR